MDLQISYQTYRKMKMLHEKLESPNYVMNNYYADAFINKIKDTSDPEIFQLAISPLMSNLVADALSRSEKHHISVKVFLTRLLAHISAKELQFVKIHGQIGDYITNCFKYIQSKNMNESLRLAYLEVALSVVEHCSGIMWLLRTGVWKDILMLASEKKTVYVVRQVYQFVSKFIWALNDLGDFININVVLKFILTPIWEIALHNYNVISNEYETEICKKIEPMCHMLLAIFSEKRRIRTRNIVMNCLISEYSIIVNMEVFSLRLRSSDTVLMCTKISFWATLASVFQSKPLVEGTMYTKGDLLELSKFYYRTLRFLLERRNVKLIFEFCNACNIIWNDTWRNEMPFSCENNKSLELQSHIVFMCLMPLIFWNTKEKNYMDVMQDDVVVRNVKHMMNNVNYEQTMRAAYGLRPLMHGADMMVTVNHSVKILSSLKLHFTDVLATYVFQVLFFLLRDYDPDEHCSQDQSRCENIIVITHLMENLLYLLKHYNLTWNESVEVLNVYSVANELLKKPNLPPRFVVVSLNVLAFSVKKFLTPNLSLLVESTPGSAVHEIGALISVKMNDEHWEVRDSALELLFVCTDISFIKFPPFQKQIVKENLINKAAVMTFGDHEPYVQASALKCLGAATRVPCFWEQLKTEFPNIQDQLISILRMNSEGAVRKEACDVLCEIYQHVKLTDTAKRKLYEFMVSSALSDFHWEVQISALKFWSIVIQTLLTDQGMLDGQFPPVTFSKESRKIVTLNAAEIQRRLLKVLDELSSIGCLTVLVKLLSDDNDTEIIEMALNISIKLIDILEEYKLTECLNMNAGEPLSVEELTCHITDDHNDTMNTFACTTQLSDSVIEEILKIHDVNLLANIYERMSLQNSNLKPEPQLIPKIRLLKTASPHFFVNYLKSKDFKIIVEHKKNWKKGIRSLSSLLDDILGVYEINNDINSVDCY